MTCVEAVFGKAVEHERIVGVGAVSDADESRLGWIGGGGHFEQTGVGHGNRCKWKENRSRKRVPAIATAVEVSDVTCKQWAIASMARWGEKSSSCARRGVFEEFRHSPGWRF